MPSTISSIVGDSFAAAGPVVAPPPTQAPAAEPAVIEPGSQQQTDSSQQSASQTLPATAAKQATAQQQLQAQLDQSLKNTGIKAEIENEKSGLVIVKFVETDSGQTIYQSPPQGVLDLIQQVEQQMQAQRSPVSGNIVNTAA